MDNIYEEEGYNSRKEYLQCMSEEYGIDYESVECIAQLLGPEEDFDGLINTLEDMADEVY